MAIFNRFFGSKSNTDSDELLIPATAPTGTVPQTPQYQPGDLIAGRYEVARRLEGGMGLVYLCADHRQEKLPVALKTFKPKFLADRNFRDRFLREGTIWVGLKYHPNIVRAYRVERLRDGLEIYLSLEWVAGVDDTDDASLRHQLRQGNPLPLKQALHLAVQIAAGMAYATETIPGLIHRDLKPENILIGRDGQARVTDFGLASILASASPAVWQGTDTTIDMTRTQYTMGVIGTPAYMAPEQWLPDGKIDTRVDIYAFGCIVYEMLTGARAADAGSINDLAFQHREGNVNRLPDDFPPELQALINGCMAVDRDHRFYSWHDVLTAVRLVYQRLVDQAVPQLGASKKRDLQRERIAAGWSYDAMGLSYYDIGNYDLAAGYFERVIWIGERESDPALTCAGLHHLGDACRALGDMTGAVNYYQRQFELAERIKDPQLESDALGNLGSVNLEFGDAEMAAYNFAMQLKLAQRMQDHRREGRALENVGTVELRYGDAQTAQTHFKAALKITRSLGNRQKEGRLLTMLGQTYLQLNQAERAVQLYERAEKIAQQFGDRIGEGLALKNLGKAYFEQGNWQKALWFLINYLHITQETGHVQGQAHALTDMGHIYLAVDDFDLARESYQSALPLVKRVGNKAWLGDVLLALGDLKRKQDDWGAAIGFYQEALVNFKQTNQAEKIAEALLKLGKMHLRNGQAIQAREYLQFGLPTLPDDPLLKGEFQYNLATAFAMEDDVEMAVQHAGHSLTAFKRAKDSAGQKKARALMNELRTSRWRRWF